MTGGLEAGVLTESREGVRGAVEGFMEKIYEEGIDKEGVREGLDYQFRKEGRSWFCYTGDSDVVAHNFSVRRVETQYMYGQQLANIRSVYDDYIRKYGQDILLVLMSDHGTYDYPHELELTTHGYQDDQNRAFAFFLSPKFKGKKLYKDKSIHISEFAGYFSLFMKNANIPLLASHRPSPRFLDEPLEELISLRSREVQLTKFVYGDFAKAIDLDKNYFMRNFAQVQPVENFKDAEGILDEYRKSIVELESFQMKHEHYLAKKDLILMLILCVPGLAIWLSVI